MMRGFIAALALGFAGLSAVTVQGQTSPPVPAPSVPPPADAAPPPPPPPAAAEATAPPAATTEPEAPATKFTLGEKRETITPGKIADGLAEGGKIDVQTAKPNTLTVLMTGAAAAHCRVGCHSVGLQQFQLVQEFDVTSEDASVTQVVLTLESTLNGYVRGRNQGGACMRLANATVTPAGWGSSPLSVAYPPLCVYGPCARLYKQEIDAPEAPPMPLGHYVLVANFLIEATADGFINGHGVANFGPDALPDPWKQENDPFKDEDAKDYGFSLTLTAAPAPVAPAGQTGAIRLKPGAPGVERDTIGTASQPVPTSSRTR